MEKCQITWTRVTRANDSLWSLLSQYWRNKPSTKYCLLRVQSWQLRLPGNLTRAHLHVNRPGLSSDCKIGCCNNYPNHPLGVAVTWFLGCKSKFIRPCQKVRQKAAFLLTTETPLWVTSTTNQRLVKNKMWTALETSLCHFCCLPFSHSHLPCLAWQWHWAVMYSGSKRWKPA